VFVQASQQVGETVDKEIVLLDFGGMSLGLLKLLPLFKAMNAVGSTYFPERTVLFFVLNAPRIFTSLWSMVKGLVDPRTQKKVHILSEGKRQLAALREVIDDSIIPVAYGGSRVAPAVSGKDEAQTRAMCAPCFRARCCIPLTRFPPATSALMHGLRRRRRGRRPRPPRPRQPQHRLCRLQRLLRPRLWLRLRPRRSRPPD
jgi:hypothetical protein